MPIIPKKTKLISHPCESSHDNTILLLKHKPYKCVFCSALFADANLLVCHVHTEHSALTLGVYRCIACDAYSVDYDQTIQHMQINHLQSGKLSSHCTECGGRRDHTPNKKIDDQRKACKIKDTSNLKDFGSISKRLGELWYNLPAKEKMAWKILAKNQDSSYPGSDNTSTAGTNQTKPARPSDKRKSRAKTRGLTSYQLWSNTIRPQLIKQKIDIGLCSREENNAFTSPSMQPILGTFSLYGSNSVPAQTSTFQEEFSSYQINCPDKTNEAEIRPAQVALQSSFIPSPTNKPNLHDIPLAATQIEIDCVEYHSSVEHIEHKSDTDSKYASKSTDVTGQQACIVCGLMFESLPDVLFHLNEHKDQDLQLATNVETTNIVDESEIITDSRFIYVVSSTEVLH